MPNPFEALGEELTITISDIPILISPTVLNLLAEPVIHIITIAVVALYYDSGSDLEVGSFLYLMFYGLHIFILWLLSKMQFAWWAVIVIPIMYYCVMKITNKRWNWGGVVCHGNICRLSKKCSISEGFRHVPGRFRTILGQKI